MSFEFIVPHTHGDMHQMISVVKSLNFSTTPTPPDFSKQIVHKPIKTKIKLKTIQKKKIILVIIFLKNQQLFVRIANCNFVNSTISSLFAYLLLLYVFLIKY